MAPRLKRVSTNATPKIRRNGGDERGDGLERNIYGFVAATLGREIVSGVYPPGSLLPNVAELCQRFGVSRTALREAYSLLTGKALIIARPKVGTWVRPRSEWRLIDPDVLAWHLESDPNEQFVADLFELRQMVEPVAAAATARLADAETIARISAAFANMERYKDGSGDLIAADLEFHMAILAGSGNPFLSALGVLIHASLQCVFRYSWAGAATIQITRLGEHGAILEAIRNRDPDGAAKRMSALLADSIGDVRLWFNLRDAERAKKPAGKLPKRPVATTSA